MGLIDINRNPSPRELRWFGVGLAIFAVIVGVLFWRAGRPTAATSAWGLGGGIMGVYAAIPMSRKWIYLGWIYAAFPIGWTVSHLLLAAIYYLIVTPIALAVRLAGSDPLQRTFDQAAPTYWTRRKPSDVARYFKQS